MNMTDYRASLYHRVLRWREEHISEKRFILILSFLVGIFTALAAWVLKWIIRNLKRAMKNPLYPMNIDGTN